MDESAMPNVVWKWLWWQSRLVWFASNCFERVFFAHCLEAQKLAMGNRYCYDLTTEEDICPSCGVHTDFESFSKQNIAGKQVRIHSRYVKYLLQGYFHACAFFAFNRDMDAPSANAVELSLCCVDFNRFDKGFVVDQDVFVRREVLRSTRIEDPIRWISAAAAAHTGLSSHLGCLCHCMEGYFGLFLDGCHALAL